MSLAIIVPYRDREEQLKMFPIYMNQYLEHYHNRSYIFIIEQADDKPFNRGKLLNVGFLETQFLYYCFHDIDMLPVAVSYKENKGVTQMAASMIQRMDYFGGVTMFNRESFKQAEGYHNDYFHRAEDNEMMFNLKAKNIPVLNRQGIFKTLPHTRSVEFIPELWEKAKLPRKINMLENCRYELISKELKEGYTHLKVSL